MKALVRGSVWYVDHMAAVGKAITLLIAGPIEWFLVQLYHWVVLKPITGMLNKLFKLRRIPLPASQEADNSD